MAAHLNENPGCLTSFLSLFQGKKKEATLDSSAEALPYRLRDDFLSPAEFSFYRVLSSMIGTRLAIQSKVRLGDIFFVARPNENASYFNRIAAKHLDFLICDPTTMKPLFGVELDDASHQRADRRERDEFVDRVFQAANLPLLHIPTQREYTTREITALIAPIVKNVLNVPAKADTEKSASPQPVNSQNQSMVAPLCPKCGIPMVVRTVSQGEHKGKQFYGCQNYPRCREMKPYPTQVTK